MHIILTLLLSSFSLLILGFIWFFLKLFGIICMIESLVFEEKIKG